MRLLGLNILIYAMDELSSRHQVAEVDRTRIQTENCVAKAGDD